MDVKVLDEDRKEVQLMETSEAGNTDLNSVLADDRNYAFESSENFAANGFTTQAVNEESGQIENEEMDMDDDYEDAPDAMDFASDLVGLADSDEE